MIILKLDTLSVKYVNIKKEDVLPIEGDLNGYLSGRSTRTFQTPPSYGAEIIQREFCIKI